MGGLSGETSAPLAPGSGGRTQELRAGPPRSCAQPAPLLPVSPPLPLSWRLGKEKHTDKAVCWRPSRLPGPLPPSASGLSLTVQLWAPARARVGGLGAGSHPAWSDAGMGALRGWRRKRQMSEGPPTSPAWSLPGGW